MHLFLPVKTPGLTYISDAAGWYCWLRHRKECPHAWPISHGAPRRPGSGGSSRGCAGPALGVSSGSRQVWDVTGCWGAGGQPATCFPQRPDGCARLFCPYPLERGSGLNEKAVIDTNASCGGHAVRSRYTEGRLILSGRWALRADCCLYATCTGVWWIITRDCDLRLVNKRCYEVMSWIVYEHVSLPH